MNLPHTPTTILKTPTAKPRPDIPTPLNGMPHWMMAHTPKVHFCGMNLPPPVDIEMSSDDEEDEEEETDNNSVDTERARALELCEEEAVHDGYQHDAAGRAERRALARYARIHDEQNLVDYTITGNLIQHPATRPHMAYPHGGETIHSDDEDTHQDHPTDVTRRGQQRVTPPDDELMRFLRTTLRDAGPPLATIQSFLSARPVDRRAFYVRVDTTLGQPQRSWRIEVPHEFISVRTLKHALSQTPNGPPVKQQRLVSDPVNNPRYMFNYQNLADHGMPEDCTTVTLFPRSRGSWRTRRRRADGYMWITNTRTRESWIDHSYERKEPRPPTPPQEDLKPPAKRPRDDDPDQPPPALST